ncbi:MraZ protein [Peptoniphilus koenoeneniae]|uniref:Transcriptional regulator MraZ n=1 Tax=Peptoniphilus koenoeneniae TaxID=507751 RepID=A0ABU0ARZ0_9FIRM|nr:MULTISPECIES: division/cell wall cluster transcriptional repressor MraZ [Peptoniphilus]ERT62212.1 protein MraZ [Peptoniphilus sp. BV3C26]MDQ0274034.1 MraZ protein [Peptoniphilus koenoeneniae]
MLIGQYNLTLDERGRITIPSKFRDSILGDFVLTKGLDNCVFLYPKNEWERITSKLKELPLSNKNARAFLRNFYSGAVTSSIDKQGRVLLPQNLRDHAEMGKELVIIGLDTRAEIWAQDKWEEFNSQEGLSYEEQAQTLDQLGI